MKRNLHRILILLAAAMLLASSCGKDKERVIPRSKLSKIYAEMLVMDQWIQNKPGLRTIADTSLVYEPILEKYGYDSEDYQHSVEHYMNDPERYSRILRSTASILDKELKSLRKQQAELKLQEKLQNEIEKYEITMFQFYDEFVTEDGLINFSDSIDVVWDTTYNAHRFRRLPRTDTIYEGPRIIVRDTVAVDDSLAVFDSLALTDTLFMMDSLLNREPQALSEKKVVPSPSIVSDTVLKKFPKIKGGQDLKLDTLKQHASPTENPKRQIVRPKRPERMKRPEKTNENQDNGN